MLIILLIQGDRLPHAVGKPSKVYIGRTPSGSLASAASAAGGFAEAARMPGATITG